MVVNTHAGPKIYIHIMSWNAHELSRHDAVPLGREGSVLIRQVCHAQSAPHIARVGLEAANNSCFRSWIQCMRRASFVVPGTACFVDAFCRVDKIRCSLCALKNWHVVSL